MRETALGEKMRIAGFHAREVRFSIAIAEFLNNGGTIDRAHELIAVAADKMGSEAGHIEPKGRTTIAEASRTDAAKGLNSHAAKAGITMPAAAPERSAGHGALAEKALSAVPAASPNQAVVKAHVRSKPGHAKRGAAAISGVQQTMAKSLFDTIRLPGDDRAIGDVTWKELQGLARRHAEAFRLLSLIDGYGVPSDENSKVRDVLKEDTLREFVEIARLSNVH